MKKKLLIVVCVLSILLAGCSKNSEVKSSVNQGESTSEVTLIESPEEVTNNSVILSESEGLTEFKRIYFLLSEEQQILINKLKNDENYDADTLTQLEKLSFDIKNHIDTVDSFDLTKSEKELLKVEIANGYYDSHFKKINKNENFFGKSFRYDSKKHFFILNSGYFVEPVYVKDMKCISHFKNSYKGKFNENRVFEPAKTGDSLIVIACETGEILILFY